MSRCHNHVKDSYFIKANLALVLQKSPTLPSDSKKEDGAKLRSSKQAHVPSLKQKITYTNTVACQRRIISFLFS